MYTSIAAFYFANSFDMDRYCKIAARLSLENDSDSARMNQLHSNSKYLKQFNVINGLNDLAIILQFENVPYLRRFKMNGEYFITSFVNPIPI